MNHGARRPGRHLRASVRKAPASRRYELLEPIPSTPLQLFPGSQRPKALLFFTKGVLVDAWSRLGIIPQDLALAVRYGLPTPAIRETLRALGDHWELPLCFVGDLRPMDLSVFMALRFGDPPLAISGHEALPIRFLGLDDDWLALCEKNLPRSRRLDDVLIRMDSAERAHWQVVASLFPELETIVGPRSLGLLRAGRTLHLEGASHPDLYGKSFAQQLLRHLRKRASALGSS